MVGQTQVTGEHTNTQQANQAHTSTMSMQQTRLVILNEMLPVHLLKFANFPEKQD